ncbi:MULTISPECIES: Sec-independent protein translocase protein TatB [unclassified Methylophilus]|uniref:Sec-independent protein translocase protein TatB n=1 Tax=unclassified Methylophilus TaxID=2630143 RepID=UPI0003699FF8|nr:MULTISPECIES: Sec-independent protein translocase protein TatB [unclassified Methylophilus]
MFDISFSELLVIALVALVVIGPEKLPKVARTAGAFFGRLQRFVTQVKDEVNRETRFAELQTLQQEVQSGLRQGYDEIEQSILPPVMAEAAANKTPVSEAVEATVVDVDVVTVKKPRKPRQRKPVANAEETITEVAQPAAEHKLLDADPQAELFAVAAEDQKKPRRPRNAAKKNDDTAPVSEHKPLA